jgi:uncharacterized cupin superfamily protein
VAGDWFVLSAREARWQAGAFGAYTRLGEEAERRFPELGINIGVLEPGQPACMYHGEADQEGFLVVSGECLLLVEGEERLLRAWDFFHCPPWTEHVLVGAGERPCVVVAFGGRAGDGVVYPASELAQRHGAGVGEETRLPSEAYARFPPDEPAAFREEWLPRLDGGMLGDQ